MVQNSSKSISKEKLRNHLIKSGKKQITEKIVDKSIKQAQKFQRKNYNKITKLAILNATPIFNLVELTNKKRRKKSIREIPTFLSNHNSRISLGLKYLIKALKPRTKQHSLALRLKDEFLLTSELESKAVALKENSQNKVLNEKKYFRHYRW